MDPSLYGSKLRRLMSEEAEEDDYKKTLLEEQATVSVALETNYWTWKRVLAGIIMVSIIVVLFSVNSELMQGLVKDGESKVTPFLTVWFAHCTGVLLALPLSVYMICYWKPEGNDHSLRGYLREEAPEYPSWMHRWFGVLLISFGFSVFYLFQNYFIVLAYRDSTVALSNTVWRASSVLVYVLSVIVLREPVLLLKAFAVLFGIAGVVILGFSGSAGSANAPNQWLGTSVHFAVVFFIFERMYNQVSALLS